MEPVQQSNLFLNPLFLTMIGIAVILLVIIVIFSSVLKALVDNKAEDLKKGKLSNPVKNLSTFLLLFLISQSVFSQTKDVTEPVYYWGIDGAIFFPMLLVIVVELLIIFILYSISLQLLGVKERKEKLAEEKRKAGVVTPTLLDKLNDFVPLEREAEIMMDHDYDGIKELDNNLPPWWKYGFYFTIVVSIIYLAYYHIFGGSLQTAEYNKEIEDAKIALEEFKKTSANLVDENNVELLTDASAIASGKNEFISYCAACHGQAGEGGVGPNLTDDYWLHGGSVKDIFKTIKYGFPEKGMKAWEQDLSAKKISEITSFIKTLKGTNPPNGKEKQGELFQEAATDSVTKADALIPDSFKMVNK